MRTASARRRSRSARSTVARNASAAEPNRATRSRYAQGPMRGASARASASIRLSGELRRSVWSLRRSAHFEELPPPPGEERLESGARGGADGEEAERIGSLDGGNEILA